MPRFIKPITDTGELIFDPSLRTLQTGVTFTFNQNLFGWKTVGDYTAGASATFEFQIDDAVLDGTYLIADGFRITPTSIAITTTPSASPLSGDLNISQTVAITKEVGSTVYYTLDGTDPRYSLTRLTYSTALSLLAGDNELNFYSEKTDQHNSIVVTEYYSVFEGTLDTPTFSPDGGSIDIGQGISISTIEENTTIYYTIDESDPRISSTRIKFDGNDFYLAIGLQHTIKAYAEKPGWFDSALREVTFIVTNTITVYTTEAEYSEIGTGWEVIPGSLQVPAFGNVENTDFIVTPLTSSAKSIQLVRPSVIAGNLLVFVVAQDKPQPHTSRIISDDPTVTLVGDVGIVELDPPLGVWHKIAGSSEPTSYSFSGMDEYDSYIGICMKITNYDPVQIIDAISGFATGDGYDPSCPGITTTIDNAKVFRAFSRDNTRSIADDTGYPTGTTGVAIRTSNISADDTLEAVIGLAFETQATAGVVAAKTFGSYGWDDWTAVTFAIRGIPTSGSGRRKLEGDNTAYGVFDFGTFNNKLSYIILEERHPTNSDGLTNALVSVELDNVQIAYYIVDQTVNGTTWNNLGTIFNVNPGSLSVRVYDDGIGTYVYTDAFRMEIQEALTVSDKLIINWQETSTITSDLECQWTIEHLHNTMTMQWSVAKPIYSDITLQWNLIKTKVYNNLQIDWQVVEKIDECFLNLDWALTGLVFNVLTSKWSYDTETGTKIGGISGALVTIGSTPVEEIFTDFDTSLHELNSQAGDFRIPLTKTYSIINIVQVIFSNSGSDWTYEVIDKDISQGPRVKIYSSGVLTNTTVDILIKGA